MDIATPASALVAQEFSQAPHMPKPGAKLTEARAKEAAQELEAFFLTQMLEHMFKEIPTDGYFGGGYGEGVYRSVMLSEYGKVLAQGGGIGLADMVQGELLRLQEAA